MNGGELRRLLRGHLETRSIFVDVFAADRLPFKPRAKRPCCYVANTENASERGEHWVVCYFHKKPLMSEYFDSFGRRPFRLPHKRFMGERFRHNRTAIQAPFSTVCGQYVLIYVLLKSRGYSLKEIQDKFKHRRKSNNDIAVVRMVEREFGITLPVMDFRFISRKIMDEINIIS